MLKSEYCIISLNKEATFFTFFSTYQSSKDV